MKRKTPPKDLGKALAQGHQPMFMTGPEIKEHFKMWPGDQGPMEAKDAWDRKLSESQVTGEKSFRYGTWQPGAKGLDRITREGKEAGVTPRSTLKKVMEKQGGTHGFISLQPRMAFGGSNTPMPSYILGGHHRVALSADQFKNTLHPVKYYEGLMDAQYDPDYK
jgi:hypothetical protein